MSRGPAPLGRQKSAIGPGKGRARRPPHWLRELVKECTLAATHAQLGGGMGAVAHLESRVRACATDHGWELGDLVRELMRLSPGREPA